MPRNVRLEGFHDLIARARAGDRAATDELLGLIRPWIEQVVRYHPPPRSPDGSVSDLVQEAWLRAWQKLDQFQGTDELQALAMFRAWLTRIVLRLRLNAARDAWRSAADATGKLLRLNGVRAADDSLPVLDPPSSEPTPSANVRAEERARLVQEALAHVADPLDREIIRLRFLEGLSLRRVAHRLGYNHETVRHRYHTILARLEQDLNGLR